MSGTPTARLYRLPEFDGRWAEALDSPKVNRDGADITFSYSRDRGLSRVILSGGEEQVADIVKAYYES